MDFEDQSAREGMGSAPNEPSSSSAPEQMKDVAKAKMGEASDRIGSLADAGKDKVVSELDRLARVVRATGEALTEDDRAALARYSDDLGERIESASRYLRDHDAKDLMSEVERFARERPLLVIGGAFAFGMVLGRFFKAAEPALDVGDERYTSRREPSVQAGAIPDSFVPSDATSNGIGGNYPS